MSRTYSDDEYADAMVPKPKRGLTVAGLLDLYNGDSSKPDLRNGKTSSNLPGTCLHRNHIHLPLYGPGGMIGGHGD